MVISANIDRIGAKLRREYLARESRKRRVVYELSQKRDALIDQIIAGRSKTDNVVVEGKGVIEP